jgi:hypothetical protein
MCENAFGSRIIQSLCPEINECLITTMDDGNHLALGVGERFFHVDGDGSIDSSSNH